MLPAIPAGWRWLLLLSASAALLVLAAADPQPDYWYSDAEILDPLQYHKEYKKAHIQYWRTVASKSARESPLSPYNNDQRACPKAIKDRRDYGRECNQDEYSNKGAYYSGGYDDGKGDGYSHYDSYGGKDDGKGKGKDNGRDNGKGKGKDDYPYPDDDTYLITGSVANPHTPMPVHRKCYIPAGKKVILDVMDDFKYYAPPLTSYSPPFSTVVPRGVRLTPDSMVSMVHAAVQVRNPDDCLYARINGQPVKDLPNYYHVAHTDDMDLAGGFLKVHSEVRGVATPAHKKLHDKGFKNTDFASAGWFLIFPKGFPKGKHEIEFGWHKCHRVGGPWWRSGKYYDGKCGCWPNAHCYGECSQFPAYGETTYGWKYSLTVE